MNITRIRLSIFSKPVNRRIGVATAVLDGELALHDIELCEAKGGELYLRFPTIKKRFGDKHEIINPLTYEARRQLLEAIARAYRSPADDAVWQLEPELLDEGFAGVRPGEKLYASITVPKRKEGGE